MAAGVVQSLHLAHDTQLVAGRHRYALDPENYCTVLCCTVLYCTVLYRYALDPENYVLGAFFHYLDILQLFLAILMVICGTNQCLK